MNLALPLSVLAGAAAIALAACSNEGCQNNRNSIPMAGFYALEGEQQLSVKGLAIYGLGSPGDSLLLDSTRSSHQVYLPLRGEVPSTSFVFSAGQISDTVTLTYNSWPYFDGEDCGAMWRYELTRIDYQRTLIDSIFITDSLITNIERERLMIFLKTE